MSRLRLYEIFDICPVKGHNSPMKYNNISLYNLPWFLNNGGNEGHIRKKLNHNLNKGKTWWNLFPRVPVITKTKSPKIFWMQTCFVDVFRENPLKKFSFQRFHCLCSKSRHVVYQKVQNYNIIQDNYIFILYVCEIFEIRLVKG